MHRISSLVQGFAWPNRSIWDLVWPILLNLMIAAGSAFPVFQLYGWPAAALSCTVIFLAICLARMALMGIAAKDPTSAVMFMDMISSILPGMVAAFLCFSICMSLGWSLH